MNNLAVLINYKKIIDSIEYPYTKKKIPKILVGDSMKLGVLIKEGNKERVQFYDGIILGIKNRGISRMINVRRVLQGIGVERSFPLYSPKLVSIEVTKSARIRRAKLYYLRNLAGKASRLKQQF